MQLYNSYLPPSPAGTAGHPQRTRQVLEVSGEGAVSVKPDQAILVLGTVTEDISLSKAQSINAADVTRTIDALLKLGIPRERIQTVQYSIDMQYDYEEGRQSFRGYKVTHMLQLTLDKVDQTGLVADTAVAHGANAISSIRFAVAHPEVYYNQALTLAVRNGQMKALTLAQALGVTLHRIPDRVHEAAQGQEPIPYNAGLYQAKLAAAAPVQPGQLEISAGVRMEYSYF